MARFLSSEWFEELEAANGPLTPTGPERVAVEVRVSGAPEGEVRYQVVVAGGELGALWRQGHLLPPDVIFSADYPTVAGIASGRLAVVDALSSGKARVSGDTSVLARAPGPVDLVPAAVRATTTF